MNNLQIPKKKGVRVLVKSSVPFLAVGVRPGQGKEKQKINRKDFKGGRK